MRVRFLKWRGDPAATSDVGICRHEGRMRESVKPLCCPILPTLAPIVGASVQAADPVCSPPPCGSPQGGGEHTERAANPRAHQKLTELLVSLVLTSYERVLQVGTATVAGRRINNGGNGRAGARAAAQGASPGRGELRRVH